MRILSFNKFERKPIVFSVILPCFLGQTTSWCALGPLSSAVITLLLCKIGISRSTLAIIVKSLKSVSILAPKIFDAVSAVIYASLNTPSIIPCCTNVVGRFEIA